MGSAKANLEWHGSTLLRRTVGIVARATRGPVVVVRAAGQELPPLPPGVHVTQDPRPGQGPLQGIAAGLAAAAAEGAGVAFVASTDLPFLHPAFVRRVLALLPDDADIALPVARGYRQPLAAAYRTSLATAADQLVAAGKAKPGFLFTERPVASVSDAALLGDAELARLDPALDSLVNVNTPEEYAEARSRPEPLVSVLVPGREPTSVRASTLRAAARAVGLDLSPGLACVFGDGHRAADDTEPAVTGDTLTFARLNPTFPL
jgi:molybdopterin-guanine dinucleotide biosynthesis protein A